MLHNRGLALSSGRTLALRDHKSPEGQAFVLMLYAAWRDWSAVGNGARTNSATPGPSIPIPSLVSIWKYRWGGFGARLVLAVIAVVMTYTLDDLFV